MRAFNQYDIVLSQGGQYPARGGAWAARKGCAQIFDLYDPVIFEQLSRPSGEAVPSRAMINYLRRLTAFTLKRGDFFLCASPRQRDLWAGALYALGRAPSQEANEDPLDLVAIVPFGHDGGEPAKTRPALKGVHPRIGPEDRVILWGGGLWDWFDPLTLIRAMKELERERPDAKLFFMSARGPGADSREGDMARKSRELAGKLGLLDKTVLFNDSWIPFGQRVDYLLEADLAVCAAPEGLENAFSFRTRLVDAIWASTPIVCTRDGFMADFVRQWGVGLTVPGEDAAAMSAALRAALEPANQARFRARLPESRAALRWDVCAQPLIRFCQQVESGQWRRPPEPIWRPWMHYWSYKAPTMLEIGLSSVLGPLRKKDGAKIKPV